MPSQRTLFTLPEARRCSVCRSPWSRPSPTCWKCELRRNPLPQEAPNPLREAADVARRSAEAARLERLRALGRPVRVALVGCGKTKRAGEHPARQLYTGTLTRLSLAYGERIADEVWILSALYGLVHPDRVLATYDCRLPTRNQERAWWGLHVRCSLSNAYLELPLHLIVLAGQDYAQPVLATPIAQAPRAWTAELPLDGLQLGQRLSWLNHTLTDVAPPG